MCLLVFDFPFGTIGFLSFFLNFFLGTNRINKILICFICSNADFTPSRGNTPVHQNVSMGSPLVNKAPFEDRVPASLPTPSPTGRNKKLAELFAESFEREVDGNDENTLGKQNMSNGKMEVKQTVLDLLPGSANGTPFVSGPNSVCSSARTPNGDFKPEKEKPLRSSQCCLPRLRSNRSFNERKKKMSPAVAVNVKA